MKRLKLTLADYPDDMIRIECSKCGRSGRLNKARLIAEHGAEITLPELRHVLQRARVVAKCTVLARRCSPTSCFTDAPNDLEPKTIPPIARQRRSQAALSELFCTDGQGPWVLPLTITDSGMRPGRRWLRDR